MTDFDPLFWGMWLAPIGLGIIGIFVLWVFPRAPRAVGVSGLAFGLIVLVIGLSMIGYHLVGQHSQPHGDAKAPGSSPSISSTPPTLENIFPIQRAINVTVSISGPTIYYFLSDWGGWSAADIDLSFWVAANGALIKNGSRRIDYLASGESVNASIVTPALPQQTTVVLCISYVMNKHRVEALHFYSNRDRGALPGALNKIRDSVTEVDGTGGLCSSMPRAAERLL